MDAQAESARDAVRAHYDGRAATYDDNLMHRGVAAEIAAIVDDEAPAGAVVVDVATGTGLVLRALARSDLRAIGVDLAPRMLAVAAASPGCRVLRGDALRLPLAGGTVDLLTCVTALHLLPEPSAAFMEWARVLRPGGIVLTATFSPTGLPIAEADFHRRHDLVDDATKIAALAAPAGFDVVAHHESEHHGERLLTCRLRAGG